MLWVGCTQTWRESRRFRSRLPPKWQRRRTSESCFRVGCFRGSGPVLISFGSLLVSKASVVSLQSIIYATLKTIVGGYPRPKTFFILVFLKSNFQSFYSKGWNGVHISGARGQGGLHQDPALRLQL